MKKILLAGLLLMVTSTANAVLINIDFGGGPQYNGQGILGDAVNTTWNNSLSTGQENLLLADGSTSVVDLTTTFNGGNFNNVGTLNDLLRDRAIGASPGTAAETITFSSLAANTAYDIVLYNGFFAQTYSITGQGISATTDPASASNNYPWTEGVEYAVLSSVMSDGSGNLAITITPFSGSNNANGVYATIAGLQIQQVPLPAAAYLFITGLLGLVGIARRKKT